MQCVLLNSDYTFLNFVDWKRAIRLVLKNKVQIVKYGEQTVKGAEGLIIRVPAVIKLIKFIRAIYRAKVHFNKRNVLIRDRQTCAYCGTRTRNLTIDHVIPKSRGGKTDFDNCVACCKSCNTKKGGHTPSEVRMYLKKRPYQPTISEFLRIRFSIMGIDDLLNQLGVYSSPL